MVYFNRKILKLIRGLADQHSAPAWTPRFARSLVRATTETLHRRYHEQLARNAIAGRAANFDDVESYVSGHPVRLRVPMVLISQVQRSGGTLLSQLFDAHPQLAAYPHELKQTVSVADRWPPLNPAKGMDYNFRLLFDRNFPRLVRRGFTKGDRNPVRHPFLLISRVQYVVFKNLWESAPPRAARDILDHFFTAFFNGWLNYQGDIAEKRWLTAFAPRLAHDEESMRAFFDCYPDGRLIQIVRDPESWFPSARKHIQSGLAGKKSEFVVRKWCVSAESMRRNRQLFGDRVILLRFEDLVGRTEETVRALCPLLDIDYAPILLQPTFNGRPMHANSSFDVKSAGVIAAPLERKAMLSAQECRLIETNCGKLYESLLHDVMAVTASGSRTDQANLR